MATKKQLSEKQVERTLVELVKAVGGSAYKWSSPARRGVPDRLVVLPGGLVGAVECKRPGLRKHWTPEEAPWEHPALTALQARELRRLSEWGMRVAVVDTRELAKEVVERWLGE